MNSWFTLPAVIGAAMGATVGWINFKVVTGLVTAKLRELDRSADAAERAEFERKLVLLRRIMFVATVPVIAGVGYWLGRTVGG